jgi:hypothetical protein
MELTILLHSPYIPDLAHSDCCIFGPLKETLQGRCFAEDKLKHIVCEELLHFNKKFCVIGVQHLMQRWKVCVDNEGNFVEK